MAEAIQELIIKAELVSDYIFKSWWIVSNWCTNHEEIYG